MPNCVMVSSVSFVPNAVQTPEAMQGIRVMFNLVPAVFFLLASVFMLFYRIDMTMLRRIEDDLTARRQPQPAG